MKRIFIFLYLINIILAFDFQYDKYKLSLNSLLTFNYDFAQRRFNTTTIKTNSFYFSKVYLDIINGYEEFFFLKFSLDVSDLEGKPSYELYSEIRPKKEIKIIFGKFKQPLGYEVVLLPKESYLFEPSFIYYWREPFVYDIGINVACSLTNWETSINLVNGSGRIARWDNNEWKDISGRFLFKPTKDIFLGANLYYGKIGFGEIKDLLPSFRLGWEMGYLKSPYILIFEYLFGEDSDIAWYKYQKHGFYLLIGYQFDNLLPVMRIDFKREKNEFKELIREIGFVFGLNYFLKGKNLKITPGFCFYRYSKTHDLEKFILQFQGYI